MKLTRGERYSLICFALVVIGFMPPVISWAAGAGFTVLGCPALLVWAASMVAATAVLMTLAFYIKQKVDGR